jgi:cupin fold WbuC family metalloprotein
MEKVTSSIENLNYFTQHKSAKTFTLFANESDFKKIDFEILIALEKKAKLIGTNARICMHDFSGEHTNEMIIAQLRNCFFPPKLHTSKTKSFTILSGKLGVYTFDNYGNISDHIILEKGGVVYTRIKSGTYHVDIPITPSAVHLEIISGPPLIGNDLAYPDWYASSKRQAFLESLPTT